MIYLFHPGTDVCSHLAAEYYFATEKNLGETVFLLWRSRPTLVVGKFQNTFEEINLRYVEEKGIDVVRRLSGGGTVYQDGGGLQFAFVDYGASEGIDFISYLKPVVAALQQIGVPAEFNGRNDLIADGRKFSGNSQYRLHGTTVHHGTLLFDTDIEEMVAATSVDPYKIASKSIKSVRERVVNLREYLPNMSRDEFRDFLATAIMCGSPRTYTLTEEDNARIAQITAETFRPWEFRFGSNPKFEIVKTGHFAGGKMEFRLSVDHGIIEQIAVYGDFFASLDTDFLVKALTGIPYRTDAVREALLPMEGLVYGVTTEEMANLITM